MGKFKQQERRTKSSAHNKVKKNYVPADPNKPDEDIVKESIHLLYLDIDELLINSKTTRRYKKLKRNGITEFEDPPRPQNRFILYKRNKLQSPEFKKRKKEDKKIKITSKEVSKLWKNETEEIIKVFSALERMAEEKHKEIYDGYKFEPKSRKTKDKESSISSCSSPPTETSPEIHNSQPYLKDDDNFISDNPQSSTDSILSNLFDEPASPHLFNDDSQFSTNSMPSDILSTQHNEFICNNNIQYYYLLDQPYLLITDQMYYSSNLNLNFDNFGQRMYNYEQQQINNFLQQNAFVLDDGCPYKKLT
ncbi:hypothetical protein RclHR1_10460002 [Rhizophagus clarus]|uniref:High mobility group box domain-containing protein n=1 Tax=Rhizophagus clarus TaxID=94130 RepID=A0A2Z6QSU1_9GLOM|nr:hypothetical protein RclHR1_10460002 [Rhizophagus clarus]GES78620.1 high mobility group box domain-containing protein [Rhizophagus clarus]